MASVDKYASPSQMKGNVTGVTKISGKAKAFAALGMFMVLGLIIFAIFTIDNDDDGQQAAREKQEQKDKEDVTPARPYDGFADMKPGLSTAKDQEMPVLDDKPASDKSKQAPDLGSGKGQTEEKERQPTAEEKAAQRAAEMARDARDRAMKAEITAKAPTAVISKADDAGNTGSTGGAGSPAAAGGDLGKLALELQQRMKALTGGNTAQDQAMADIVGRLSSGQDDPNKQVRKEQFMTNAGASSRRGYLPTGKTAPLAKYELKSTQIIPAMMFDQVNSDLPQTVSAIVTETVYDFRTGKCPLIPQNTRAEGVVDSQVAFGQTRIPVYWNKLIFPDGSTYFIDGMPGTDPDGTAGFTADVNNHYFKIFGGGVLLSVISTAAQRTDGSQQSVYGSQPTVKSTMASSLGQQINQTSTALIQKGMNIQPTLSRKVGMPFNIKITQDMIFPGKCGD